MTATDTMDRTKHLTSEEMDTLLFAQGSGDETAAQHMRECAFCGAEMAEMRSALGAFREVTTGFAAKAALERPRTNLLPSRPSWSGAWFGERSPFRMAPAWFAVAASLTVAAVLLPLGRPLPKPEVAVQQPVAQPARSVESDDALLRDIDQQLDASVPTAMEPLANPALGYARASEIKTKETKKD